MTEAADRLARSRQAILAYAARPHRHPDPRKESAGPVSGPGEGGPDGDGAREAADEGWFDHLLDALRAGWRDHPAHIAADLATPLLRDYAQRKPLQLLGLALAAGAALTFARRWRLISLTTVLLALLKSSRLSELFLAAMSAADYRKDPQRPDSGRSAGG